MKDMIGKTLGRYKIKSLVGEGGMAIVYLAEDTTLHREVAVKMIRVGEIPPNQLPCMLERFKREAEALARLSDDPAIVTVHDYGEYEGCALPGDGIHARRDVERQAGIADGLPRSSTVAAAGDGSACPGA